MPSEPWNTSLISPQWPPSEQIHDCLLGPRFLVHPESVVARSYRNVPRARKKRFYHTTKFYEICLAFLPGCHCVPFAKLTKLYTTQHKMYQVYDTHAYRRSLARDGVQDRVSQFCFGRCAWIYLKFDDGCYWQDSGVIKCGELLTHRVVPWLTWHLPGVDHDFRNSPPPNLSG